MGELGVALVCGLNSRQVRHVEDGGQHRDRAGHTSSRRLQGLKLLQSRLDLGEGRGGGDEGRFGRLVFFRHGFELTEHGTELVQFAAQRLLLFVQRFTERAGDAFGVHGCNDGCFVVDLFGELAERPAHDCRSRCWRS
ncbi:hypothetical protein CPI83_29705 (plasmid) [Rhodococcus sp. H-CA8f]|nr:hypothetical protein CPI83_29705 [Rhodococcus sp. H-CA8f]